MTKPAILIFICFSLACSNDDSFIQTLCEADSKSISMLFKNKTASRDIYLNLTNNTIRFKGTTLSDFKWVDDLDENTKFQINDNGLMSYQPYGNRVVEFGVLTPECKAILQNKLKNYFL